jgi:predicted CopG family antitoxin
MNTTQQKLYQYLLKSYEEKDIFLSRQKVPNFYTADGKGWEAKRLYGKKIILTKEQYGDLLLLNNTEIVVFTDGSDNPYAKLDTTDLLKPVDIEVHVARATKPIIVYDDDYHNLTVMKTHNKDFKTYADVIRFLLKNYNKEVVEYGEIEGIN